MTNLLNTALLFASGVIVGWFVNYARMYAHNKRMRWEWNTMADDIEDACGTAYLIQLMEWGSDDLE